MRLKKDPGASAWPFERKCPECRKRFCIPITEVWTYRDGDTLLCSWSCVRAREARQQAKEEAEAAKRTKNLTPEQKETLIRRMVCRGLTNDEISLETGFSRQMVNYYRRKIEEDRPEK